MRRKIEKYISMGMTAVMLLGAVPMQTVLGADSVNNENISAPGADIQITENYLDETHTPAEENSKISERAEAGIASEDITETFTDNNFRAAVREKLGLKDAEPITGTACAAVKELDVSGKDIDSLAGIEYFTGLTNLDCSNNRLISLDITNCTKLAYFSCGENQLSELNVKECPNLMVLDCSGNYLTDLDVTNCNNLRQLTCGFGGRKNQLKSLDVSKCPDLMGLYIHNNDLTELNLENCPELDSLACNSNHLKELNLEKCPKLTFLHCSDNQFTKLDLRNCPDMTSLECVNNQLAELNVEGCTALKYMHCNDNRLTALDLSDCASLEWLYCDNNQLTSLDVGSCVNLNKLSCTYNNMKSIDAVKGRPAGLSGFQFEPQNHASEITPDPVPSQIPPEPSIPAVSPDPTPDITPDPTPLPTPNPAAQNFKETCFVKEIVGKEKTFEIPSAGRARLTFEECVNPESYSLRISGCRVSDFRLTEEKEKASTNWFAVSSGTLKVNLSSSQPVNDEAVAYVEYEAGGSYVGEVESNDSFETANKIAVNTDYWAAGGNNWDYFYFEVDGPSKVEFPETFRTYWNDGSELLLYREDEKKRRELYSQAFGDSEESFLPSMRLTKGKYYLAIYPRYYCTYTMRVNLTQESAESYEQESNDLQSKANKKEVNKPYTGNINIRNLGYNGYNFDIDWYQFDIPNKSYLAAELKVPSEASGKVKASLKNAAKDDILTITSTDNPYIKSEETLVEPGTYYICMERGSEYKSQDENAYWDYTICLNQRDYIELNSISLPSSETMAVRQSKFLTPTFIPANATEQTLLWESSNEKVVTVNEEGAVSTKAEGTATITAKAKHDPSIQAQCQIRVTKTGVPPATVTPPVKPDNSPTPAPGGEPGNTPTPGGTDDPGAAKQVKLNKSSLSLKAGNTSRLKLNNAKGKVTWRSSSPSTVSVSSSGLVKGKKLGKATVRAYYNGRVYSCRVTVNSLFKKAVWYGYSNGGYYFWVRSISGKTMKVSIHMPNMTIKNKRATINANGKTATLKFKCGKRKTHSLTIRASGGSIVIQEKSSCTKKIMTVKSRERKKTIKHTFRPVGWVWWRY